MDVPAKQQSLKESVPLNVFAFGAELRRKNLTNNVIHLNIWRVKYKLQITYNHVLFIQIYVDQLFIHS